MSGHSHYATIKRQKAAADAVKGNIFSKHAKAIMLAAKEGANPESNFKLRVAIDRARADNMPKENIKRAIERATSEGGVLSEAIYEGFGPFGVAVIVEAATDNKNRTAQEIKNLFERGGGSLAGPGAVSFNFESKGFLLVEKSEDKEAQILAIIDMGIDDIAEGEDGLEVFVTSARLGEIKEKIEAAGFRVIRAELRMKPKSLIQVSPDEAEKIMTFLETLESHDDVQKVYANI